RRPRRAVAHEAAPPACGPRRPAGAGDPPAQARVRCPDRRLAAGRAARRADRHARARPSPPAGHLRRAPGVRDAGPAPARHGQPFLTKPPLMYWLSAALFTVTGPTEHARLWPALAGLGTVAATGALGALWFGEGAGIGAALILATSAGFFVESRLLRADMVLV